ncbi:MAG: hypothetical protein AVDCRST_MAG79-2624, partial [uncultured Thermoleophilia bacterium]
GRVGRPGRDRDRRGARARPGDRRPARRRGRARGRLRGRHGRRRGGRSRARAAPRGPDVGAPRRRLVVRAGRRGRGRGPRAARDDRHPGQQRGRLPRRAAHAGRHRRGVAALDRRDAVGRLLLHAGCGPDAAREAQRLGRQRVVDPRLLAEPRAHELLRAEGGGPDDDPGRRGRVGRVGRPGERRLAGLPANADVGARRGPRRDRQRLLREPRADEATRSPGGGRRPRRVPRLGPRVLHHRCERRDRRGRDLGPGGL